MGKRAWLITGAFVLAALLGLAWLTGAVLVGVAGIRDATHRNLATIGQSVRDGGLEFTVSELQCGVDSDLLGVPPRGQYCVASISAHNVSREPQTFDPVRQVAYGPDGVKFGADE